jgi:predicted dehydrogenase
VTDAVRWGFLGAGWIARRALAPAVAAASGAQLVAAAARDASRAAALGPSLSAYESYDALLADPEVDAVYLSLTNEAHRPWTVAALQAGKHVLCEKPLGLTAAEVDAMAEAATAAGRLLVEASWYRWHPRVQAAAGLVAAGAIGDVHRMSAGFTFAGDLAGNYRLDPARGGGALYDVGCYAASAALWAFAPQTVRSVVATQRVGPSGVDLVTEAELRFDNGVALLRAGISEPPRQWLEIDGSRGRIEFREAAYTSWVDDATELALTVDGRTEVRRFEPVDAYRVMVEAVSTAIAGGEAWLLPVAESRATAAVLDACFASARAGGAEVALS